ncbi:MAG: LysE family translocator, partial [Rhodoferax sp.]|nr:LysE family translocator [Rhodoferax sp.]
PWGFWKAAAFQWLNPKAWVMCVTAMTAYLPVGASLAQVALLPLLFMVIGLPAVGSWAAFGSAMRRFLQDPVKRRVFNVSMALALLASLYPLLTG